MPSDPLDGEEKLSALDRFERWVDETFIAAVKASKRFVTDASTSVYNYITAPPPPATKPEQPEYNHPYYPYLPIIPIEILADPSRSTVRNCFGSIPLDKTNSLLFYANEDSHGMVQFDWNVVNVILAVVDHDNFPGFGWKERSGIVHPDSRLADFDGIKCTMRDLKIGRHAWRIAAFTGDQAGLIRLKYFFIDPPGFSAAGKPMVLMKLVYSSWW